MINQAIAGERGIAKCLIGYKLDRDTRAAMPKITSAPLSSAHYQRVSEIHVGPARQGENYFEIRLSQCQFRRDAVCFVPAVRNKRKKKRKKKKERKVRSVTATSLGVQVLN